MRKTKDVTKIDVRVSIGRSQSTTEGECIHIRVEDYDARICFLEMEMSCEEFARAITGMGYTKAEAIVNGLDLVGTVGENKTEKILVPEYPHKEDPEEYLPQYEVDGWHGLRADFKNPHRWHKNPDGTYSVTVAFFRNVSKVKGKTKQ